MDNSMLKTIDVGLKALLYSRFKTAMGLTDVNDDVLQYPEGIAHRERSEKKGVNTLEFVSYWRVNISNAWNRRVKAAARQGIPVTYVDSDNKQQSNILKTVPIDLVYDVIFWSRSREKINDAIETYLFWQDEDPNLDANYVIGSTDIPLELDLHFDPIQEETTIGDKYIKGQYFKAIGKIKIDGWIIKSTTGAVIHKIILMLYDKDSLTNYSQITVEDSSTDTELQAALKLYQEHIYGIMAVDLTANAFHVKADSAAEFTADLKIYVFESTGNDQKYTVVSSSLLNDSAEDDVTEVVVEETIADSTADGVISLKNM